MTLHIETEIEADGRWIAKIPDLPGTMVYASSHDEAILKVKALALHVIADRIEAGDDVASTDALAFVA